MPTVPGHLLSQDAPGCPRTPLSWDTCQLSQDTYCPRTPGCPRTPLSWDATPSVLGQQVSWDTSSVPGRGGQIPDILFYRDTGYLSVNQPSWGITYPSCQADLVVDGTRRSMTKSSTEQRHDYSGDGRTSKSVLDLHVHA